MLKLLLGPLRLPGLLQLRTQRVAQTEKELDIKRGVDQPGWGQGSKRPVGCRMVLCQAQSQGLLGNSSQSDSPATQEPRCQLCVEQGRWPQAQRVKARQILVSSVQHPQLPRQHLGERTKISRRERVDKDSASTVLAQLDKVGILTVPEPGRPLGVDGDRAPAMLG